MMATLTITLYFTAVLAAYQGLVQASEREKGSIQMNQGQTFTMKCQTADNKIDSFSLFARHPGKDIVAFYDKNTNSFTIEEHYKKRVSISGSIQTITMELKDLQLKDSGLYLGQYSKFNLEKNVEEEEEGCAILLQVNEVNKMAATEKVKTGAEASALSEPQILVFALTACTLVIVFGLMVWVCIPKVKARCRSEADGYSVRDYNPVYEDMHRVRK